MHDIKEVLVALQSDGPTPGPAWRRAHELAQKHEGEALYDRLHALLHRIEGDGANAGYWYRRAGEPVFTGDVMEEIGLLMEKAG